ncbi:hypothetical protein [Candidatus Vondammii sp. HM_W22]|uniref:hypothetical protein n=1 Tax=Candidatus Vondammii sp. HM_W22 TaxID=2687299 RepID=UPI002E7BBD6F|nr:hypothetical protein [Candidatus Vondammii sp. HM_W22]
MHDSQLLPIKDVMYEQAPFIDLAINRLTLTGLLIHAPHRHSTEEIAAWLKQGRWAYLNPQPEQPLLVWYKKNGFPTPPPTPTPPPPAGCSKPYPTCGATAG